MSWLATAALAPLLWWQGRRVRRVAMRLPEAQGGREGIAGAGTGAAAAAPWRLLVVGDSSAAGVGVDHQAVALAAPLAEALSHRLHRPVHWRLQARSGHRAHDLLATLRTVSPAPAADLMLVVAGVNDASALTPTRTWLAALQALHDTARDRCGVRQVWHSALPPMGRFPLLPQPLRWVMGRHAARLDAALQAHVRGHAARRYVPLPAVPAASAGDVPAGWVAADGFHPGPLAYRAWALSLAEAMAAELGTAPVPSDAAAPHCMQ
ncbi:SGNH/GDSL hydrolase family protein [Ideonella sp.]|uniref:SGNH/GDSL hydrolase family protein n=1 Tax=Ideonella sp. TaxID=1929293 RepID=UPI0035B464D3